MTSNPNSGAGVLAARLPHVPTAIGTAMQAYLDEHATFPQRGMPAVLEDFFTRLDAAGLAPPQVTEEVFRRVGTSRSRFRCLIAALRLFAPDVPLSAAAPVRKDWDAWLNARYNKRPAVAKACRRVGVPPEDWPASWSQALPSLDRSVRPYGERLRKLAPRTKAAVISAMGLLAQSRNWAASRGVDVSPEPSEMLFEVFLHYLHEERDVSFGTARDYLESARMFFLRAGLFKEASYAALGEMIGALTVEAEESDPGKWARLKEFRKRFNLADILQLARAAADRATTLAGHSAAAIDLRQKAMIYALLVNSSDRQGDLREYRIGIELVRDARGDWCHGIRQGKTGRLKEIDRLWPGTSALIDQHILGDRPDWQIADRLVELEGRNLLTLSERVVGENYINKRLAVDFGIHGHLVRTLIADLLRRTRPDALWSLQAMLGHTDRHTQRIYRSDFDESAAVQGFDRLLGAISEPSD